MHHSSKIAAGAGRGSLATSGRLKLAMAVITALSLQLVILTSASADNDFAGAVRTDQGGAPNVAGFRGTQDIRTNPGAPDPVTLAHPFQVFFAGDAFYAVGTYKGHSGQGSCVENNGAWSSYIDGVTPGGLYFCNLQQAQAYTAGSTPNFRIQRDVCSGGFGWEVFINNNSRQCREAFSNMTARGGGVALEVARAGLQLPPDAYNIDVKHSGLELFTAAFGQWYALDANQVVNTRPGGYSVVRPNAKGVNSFHGTLD